VSHPKRKEQISAAICIWLVWWLNETVFIQPLTKVLCSTLATIGWHFMAVSHISQIYFLPRA